MSVFGPSIVGEFRYREQPGKWRFVLDEPLRIYFPSDWWGIHELADKDGRVWARTSMRDWEICKGYAWDGSSFAINFKETLAASCWHDAAGQFRHLLCLRPELPGAIWNLRFAQIIAGQGAPKVAALYHAGLMLGNPFYSLAGKLFGAKHSGQCLAHPRGG